MMSSLSLTESWCSLMAAIVFGVLGTISMKLSNAFQEVRPTVVMAVFYSASFVAMTFALKTIDISIVYAIWSGVGTVLAMVMSVFLFEESISLRKAFFLLLIVIGIVGLQFINGSF
jgi:small multidrug resistance pump